MGISFGQAFVWSIFDRCMAFGGWSTLAMAIVFITYMMAVYVLFFLPVHLARRRQAHVVGVSALNILLGWTGIGWVAALILSLSGASNVVRS